MSAKMCLYGVVAIFLSCATYGYTSTIYVDCRLSDYSGHDGSSWSKALKTIQEGVDAATEGGLVLVARGDYTEGGKADAGGMNRVYVSKRGLTLRSHKGADVTHIVGMRDTKTPKDNLGNGPNAVRCVLIGANDIIIEGFTLRDGAAHPAEEKQNRVSADGGGVRVTDSSYRSCIVDCVVSNCVGVRGGGMRYGTAVRTLFTGNAAYVKGLAGNASRFMNCVMDNNLQRSGNPVAVAGKMVNCAVLRHAGSQMVTESAKVYNSIFMLNGALADNSETVEFFNCAISGNTYSDKGVAFFKSLENCVTNLSPYMMVAPIFGDYRLIPGSAAAGLADASHLTEISLPAGVDRHIDFQGIPIAQTGTINAGPVQTEATAIYGGLCFDATNCTVNGKSLAIGQDYFFTTNWPSQFKIAPFANGNNEFWGFLSRFPNGGNDYRFPLLDGTTWMLPPPSGLITNELKFAVSTIYADPHAPAGGDGSKDKPFNTLQAAVNACPEDTNNTTKRSIVRAAVGTYSSDSGLIEACGIRNRLTIDRKCRVIGAGADVTFIAGASDPNGPAGDGRGPNAIRSVSFTAVGACLQGFTLCDGRSGYPGSDGTANENAGKGGGVYIGTTMGEKNYVLDCVVSNAVGYRGAVFGGIMRRTRVTDSEGYNGTVRYCRIVNCVIDRNRHSSENSIDFSSNNEAYGCTFVGSTVNDRTVTVSVPMTNCIICKTSSIKANTLGGGCYAWNVRDALPVPSPVTLADPQMISIDDCDYRLLTTSPLYGGGVWGDTVWKYHSPSIDGLPLKFRDGMPTPGAYHGMAQGIVVIGKEGAVFTPSGTNVIEAGSSLTVLYDGSGATRPVVGVKVNGELTESTTTSSWTFAAPPEGEATEPFVLEVLTGTNWFVNANMPDDSGNGFTKDTAKRTFHGENGLFTVCDIRSGDCVHAAPGTYSEGKVYDPGKYIATRLAVPEGVTVASEEGPRNTFIMGGESETDEFRDHLGRGTNAIRSVFLHENAKIKGFTITGGRTLTEGSTRNETYGGGVLCDYSPQSYVENCIISNNAAVRGGGVHGGTVKNCLIVENYANKNRAGVSESFLYNSVVDRNRGESASQNLKCAVNCTFGTENTHEDGTTPAVADTMPHGPVINCLFKGFVKCNSDKETCYSNCVFASDSLSMLSEKQMQYVKLIDCIIAEPGNLELNDDYSPVYGSCVAIDAGSLKLLMEAGDEFAHKDLYGGQRIYNAAPDAGAIELDFRPIFSTALGASVKSVEKASPGVSLSGSTVRLTDGDSLTALVAQEGRHQLHANITDGTLSVDVGGSQWTASASGKWWLNVLAGTETIAFTYEGSGFVDLVKLGRTGTVIMFR